MELQADLRILKPGEKDSLIELISIFEDVFAMKAFKRPGDDHLDSLLRKENFFAVAAYADNKMVGGLTVYVLDQYFSERPLAYILDLAVLTAYQRKGIGRKLIAFTNEYCRRKGFEEVFVQADKADDYAIDFYRLTKPGTEEAVVHFTYELHERTYRFD